MRPPASAANATTWKLVTTMPLGETIIPVPSSSWVGVFTSMETTAGSTRCTRAGIPAPSTTAGPGSAEPSLMVVTDWPLLWPAPSAVTPEPTAAWVGWRSPVDGTKEATSAGGGTDAGPPAQLNGAAVGRAGEASTA